MYGYSFISLPFWGGSGQSDQIGASSLPKIGVLCGKKGHTGSGRSLTHHHPTAVSPSPPSCQQKFCHLHFPSLPEKNKHEKTFRSREEEEASFFSLSLPSSLGVALLVSDSRRYKSGLGSITWASRAVGNQFLSSTSIRQAIYSLNRDLNVRKDKVELVNLTVLPRY